jgi:hypothetical protein
MSETNRTTWNFLENTYWYVTYSDLTALQFSLDDNLLSWEGDQTVWHISGYKNGYFWGVSSSLLFDQVDTSRKRTESPRQLALVGTVTAGGHVQISFIRSKLGGDSITTGFGQMTTINEQWAFQMQMSTTSGNDQLFHWANMMQTKKGEPSWDKLPGISYSVPAMFEGANYPQFADKNYISKQE